MKKHLIAAAVAAAVAVPAAAQVSVYGRFDQAYYYTKAQTAGSVATKNTSTGLDGGVGGSRLGFKGSEDLGGGMKAEFVLEFGADWAENVGANATRLGFVGLDGGFGTFRMGRQVSPVKAIQDGFFASGNNTNFAPGEVHASGDNARAFMNGDNRVSNAITYITPSMAGVTAQLQYSGNSSKTTVTSTNETANATTNSGGGQDIGQGISLNYSTGPLSIAYGQFEVTDKATTTGAKTDDETSILAATYGLPGVKLHLAFAEREAKNATTKTMDRSMMTIGATIPMGAWSFNLQMSSGEAKALTTGDTVKEDVDAYKLRANYALSKRTSLYGMMGQTELKPSGGNKEEIDGYAIGLIHTF
jgi:predicted porin